MPQPDRPEAHDPSDLVARQRAHFDGIADAYLTARSNANHLELKRLLWHEFLLRNRALFGSAIKVLEPMCGFAEGAGILREHLGIELDYRGFDYSPAVVAQSQRAHPDLRIEMHDVTRFSSEERFDVVLILGGLHHVPHAAAEVVGNLGRVLRPGGLFLSLEPTHGNPLFARVRESIYRRNPLFDAASERAFAVKELFGFFASAGFELRDAMFPGLLSYVLYYNPDAFPRLNTGSPAWVRRIWRMERPFLRSRAARVLSFATLTLWQKR